MKSSTPGGSAKKNYFVHANGLCETEAVGEGTRIWAFAHVLPGARIGRDCNICDNVFIENDVVVGDRVTVKCGVQLWDGLRVEDDVFIGPNATFTNDRFPRSKQYQEKIPVTTVQKHASIGANSTILPGITIGAHAMVGAGATVTQSVPNHAIVVGNPAHIVGYVDSERVGVPPRAAEATPGGREKTAVAGVELFSMPVVRDLRGSLSANEFDQGLPFRPRRYFLVFDVPSRDVRGEHAHRVCHQFLVAVKGSCSVVVDDGKSRVEVLLNRPSLGIYVPPMVWGIQYKFSPDAVLLVLASHPYDAADYIRNYDEFLSELARDPARG